MAATTGKWQPQGDDAFKLASLHWWAMKIEQTAIEIYATDRSKYKDMTGAFRELVIKMKSMAGPRAVELNLGLGCESSSDCPDGMICCQGICEPEDACGIETAALGS